MASNSGEVGGPQPPPISKPNDPQNLRANTRIASKAWTAFNKQRVGGPHPPLCKQNVRITFPYYKHGDDKVLPFYFLPQAWTGFEGSACGGRDAVPPICEQHDRRKPPLLRKNNEDDMMKTILPPAWMASKGSLRFCFLPFIRFLVGVSFFSLHALFCKFALSRVVGNLLFVLPPAGPWEALEGLESLNTS